MNEDLIRELRKAVDTLTWAEKYLTSENEANAALHMNTKVFYSPLTTQIHHARGSLERMVEQLSEGSMP
jgi:hypothetical protein